MPNKKEGIEMTIEELTQKTAEIDSEIEKLTQVKAELNKQFEIEENSEDEKEEIKMKESNNSFINVIMSIMSFLGIIIGIFYVIYSKKEGLS